MAIGSSIAVLKFQSSGVFGTAISSSNIRPVSHTNMVVKPLVIEARANTRTENAKIRNIRLRKKFNGTATKPRLSVFCSDKQLYAVLVDDQNKKCLFYGSTLQSSIRKDQSCTTLEAAKRVGEELIKTCVDLNINEISCYDRNGLARGERMRALVNMVSCRVNFLFLHKRFSSSFNCWFLTTLEYNISEAHVHPGARSCVFAIFMPLYYNLNP